MNLVDLSVKYRLVDRKVKKNIVVTEMGSSARIRCRETLAKLADPRGGVPAQTAANFARAGIARDAALDLVRQACRGVAACPADGSGRDAGVSHRAGIAPLLWRAHQAVTASLSLR